MMPSRFLHHCLLDIFLQSPEKSLSPQPELLLLDSGGLKHPKALAEPHGAQPCLPSGSPQCAHGGDQPALGGGTVWRARPHPKLWQKLFSPLSGDTLPCLSLPSARGEAERLRCRRGGRRAGGMLARGVRVLCRASLSPLASH